MKKYINATLVVFVLFVLPLVTWMFLKEGEKYLLEAADDILIVKDSLSDYTFLCDKSYRIDTITRLSLTGIVSVMFKESDYNRVKTGFDKINLQFANVPNLQFVQLYKGQHPQNDISKDFKISFKAYKDINNFSSTLRDNHFVIIDTKGYIRAYYSASEENYISLIKHLGLLLPPLERNK